MPSYAKFMKDIISKKRKLGEHEIVKLSEECSAILQRKLPHKLKDPGSFTIPCTIGTTYFEKALCDLGSNFLILDMEEDAETPIILGRLFLKTGRTLIDVDKGLLILRVDDEQVTFNVFEATKYPVESDSCFLVDIVKKAVSEKFKVE
ncbi:uncharacterized protein LOC109950362 [Prunus persica]|uniref:uncharacterized protein LOC109950362 n=1 Tax=Prunus persica TaxID=3760 RepID=UPI0009AB3B1A|nr:uncharacterized protein LOC109950362 [Prunus persica]